MGLQIIYIYMYKQLLVLDNLQLLMRYKIKSIPT